MHGELRYPLVQDRLLRAGEEADARRLARIAKQGTPGLRARAARTLFALAVKAERRATWDEVWDRLEARGRL